MVWVYGVDCSFDPLSESEAQALKGAGVQVFAQCLWTGNQQPEPRVTNLRVASWAGFVLIGYISISTGRPGWQHVDAARQGVPEDIWNQLVKAPIDVELEGLTHADVISAHDRISSYGKSWDVYTNYNTWVNVLGNPTRRQGTGLWNAYWNEHPDFNFPSLPFGGFNPLTEVWGEQWSGGVTLPGGQFADRNQFRIDLLKPTTTLPPPTSTLKQRLLQLNTEMHELLNHLSGLE